MVISMVIGIVADLNRYLLSVFLRDGAVYPNTLLAGRLISFGLDPIIGYHPILDVRLLRPTLLINTGKVKVA